MEHISAKAAMAEEPPTENKLPTGAPPAPGSPYLLQPCAMSASSGTLLTANATHKH